MRFGTPRLAALRKNPVLTLVVGACVLVSAAIFVWTALGFIREWQRSTTVFADRRAQGAVDLMFAAFVHDMRGVQRAIHAPMGIDPFAGAPLAERRHFVDGLFSRYQYPEAFFAWHVGSPKSAIFFTRPDRRPPWIETLDADQAPVVIGHSSQAASALVPRIDEDARLGRRFSAFEIQLLGEPYQVVATLSPSRGRDAGTVFGFLVNLHWAREHYFPSVIAQVARTTFFSGIAFAVDDSSGSAVVEPAWRTRLGPTKQRTFPPLFFEPALIADNPPQDLQRGPWSASATVATPPMLLLASPVSRRAAGFMAFAGLVLAVGVALTVRAVRTRTRLAEMRADFVSSVSHELKTPIATLRAISENLAAGRATNAELTREFGRIGLQEAQRLSRLVDNLLAYARITDVTEAYAFEPQSIAEIVDESLSGFRVPLAQGGFDVHVDIPSDLPPVRADRLALELAISNVIDNAVRYSGEHKAISITAHAQPGSVNLQIADRGVGIPERDIQHVTRKFYRVPSSGANGNGLGLAIVQRIVDGHGGALRIASEVGVGTTVTLQFPAIPSAAAATA